jgi:predicted HicB family RNase H-like nuclease
MSSSRTKNYMTVDEFADEIKRLNDKVLNFHKYNSPAKQSNRPYKNTKRGDFWGKKA